MVEPSRRPRSVTAALLTDLVVDQVRTWQTEVGLNDSSREAGAPPVHVVDLGGGTGVLAAELARHGHQVTVVDPSPDALASLERRAAEEGLADRLTGRQGDASELVELIGADGADVVVCHHVLELVDDPAEALAAIRTTLRPAGLLSLVVAQRPAAVLAHALAGHLVSAKAVLADPRRFDRSLIIDLVGLAGFEVIQVHGIGAIASVVGESQLRGPGDGWAALHELELQISSIPDFQAVAPQLHLAARRPAPSAAPG